MFVEVDGIVMQGPVARLSRTPAEMRWAGRALGADTDEVLADLNEPTETPPRPHPPPNPY